MSPIIGLTTTVKPSFPNLGTLHKGSVKKLNARGNESFGDDLPYFRLASDRPQVVRAFTECFGAQPAVLQVFLPFPTVDENWSAWNEEWVAGGLLHRCDGKTCIIYRDTKTGKMVRDDPKPCPGGCHPVGRLSIIIPALWQAGFVGIVTLQTHSLNDIMHIESVLRATYAARMSSSVERGLMGVEFTISRRQEQISTPGTDGKRVRRAKWLVKIEPSANWVVLQLEAARRLANQPLIEARDEDDGDEDAFWGEGADMQSEDSQPVGGKIEAVEKSGTQASLGIVG